MELYETRYLNGGARLCRSFYVTEGFTLIYSAQGAALQPFWICLHQLLLSFMLVASVLNEISAKIALFSLTKFMLCRHVF